MRKFTIFINVCVLFFLITYFFLSRWYLLLFVRFSSCVYHVLTESFLVIRCKKRDHSQKNYQSRITLAFMGNIYLCPAACLSILSWHFYWRPVSQWYEHPRVLGILIPKPLVIWVIPLTLTQIAKVVWEGDAYIASVFNGNGDAHITVTTGVLHWFYYGGVRLSLRDSRPVPHKINKFATLLQK